MTAIFGGGWEGALALDWDELLLRYVEAAEIHDETWGAFRRALAGRVP